MKSKIFSIDGREDFVTNIVKIYNQEADPEDRIIKGKVRIDEFSDNEISINFQETIRGLKVYLVCSTNTSTNIMKLMLSVDAAKRASAKEIIAVVPYYGYGRQDRKDGMRAAIGARVFADMIQSVGYAFAFSSRFSRALA